MFNLYFAVQKNKIILFNLKIKILLEMLFLYMEHMT